MNFGLNVANKVEDHLQTMIDGKIARDGHDYVDDAELDTMYKLALDRTLQENSKAKAGGNIRLGEIILIVDADTRVVSCPKNVKSMLTFVKPVDCLLYGAAEMFLSPEVAIVQHSTGVMQVVEDYFENGITFFTNMVYTAVSFLTRWFGWPSLTVSRSTSVLEMGRLLHSLVITPFFAGKVRYTRLSLRAHANTFSGPIRRR